MKTRLSRLTVSLAFAGSIALTGAMAIADPPKGGYAPDPPGHASRTRWTFGIHVEKGVVHVQRATHETFAKPVTTPRVMGRFAIEFYEGTALLDRVRFDVPLMGDDPSERKRHRLFARPTFDIVTTNMTATMADHEKASAVAFVDRATGDVVRFAWPPPENGVLAPLPPPQKIANDEAPSPSAPTSSAKATPPAPPSSPAPEKPAAR